MEDILVCAPVQPASSVYPGSVQCDCNGCGIKVWVAPSGQKLARESAVTIVCTKCALDRIEKAPESPEIMITQEAAEEVAAWLKRN